VINFDSPHHICSPDAWHPIPGSLESMAKLTQAGFKLAIITNQSGIGKGLYTADILSKIHQKLLRQLEQLGGTCEKIYYCPHHPLDNCLCRKPNPGLIHQFSKDFKVELTPQTVYFIGDSLKDIHAGIAANCQPILVKTGNGLTTQKSLTGPNGFEPNVLLFNNLEQALNWIYEKHP
jgi:D-glycero-D-manno-heptose 1,7-bisphosphate phosphatase